MTRDEQQRLDLKVMAGLVSEHARVLDIGCGDGALLQILEREKFTDGRGIELSQQGVNECVARGLPVIQGDADRDLVHYPDNSFDFVILSQTIQATHSPKLVLKEMLRIGKNCIISVPNFGHWSTRTQLFLNGRMPVNKNLPYSWYDTPNIHFCTLNDFFKLIEEVDATILDMRAFSASGYDITNNMPKALWNILAQQAIFLLTKKV